MAPVICFQEGRASKATTWTCRVPNCNIPQIGEFMDHAETRGMSIGLEPTSHSMIIQFATPQTHQGMERNLTSILASGGSNDHIEDIECLDLFHAESWGLVSLHAPKLPESVDILVEEDELEEDELEEDELEEDELEAGPHDIFAAGLQELQVPKTIRVPEMVRALSMESACQKELRIAMEKAGGTLSDALEAILFPKGRDHVNQIQDEARALARPKPIGGDILWIGYEPEFITVCAKPKMIMERKVRWIVWKAEKLGLNLTLPVLWLSSNR